MFLTLPRRQPRQPPGDGGCGPCPSTRDQIHQHLVTANTVISPWDNRPRKITKKLNCVSPNLVYYLKCTDCPAGADVTPHYVGSSVRFKGRWSSHKNDMIRGVGKDCGFCEHWARHHKANLTDISKIEIYFLDNCEDPGRKEDDYPKLKNLEEKWMVSLGSLGSLDPVQGCNKRDDAKAKARWNGS